MDFRGGIIEDLHLPPPTTINCDLTIADAVGQVIENFPEIPEITAVFNRTQNHIEGYLNAETLSMADEKDKVLAHVLRDGSMVANICDPIESLVQKFSEGAKVVEIRDASDHFSSAAITEADIVRRFPQLYKAGMSD